MPRCRRDGSTTSGWSCSVRTSASSAASSGSPTGCMAEFGDKRCFDTPLAEAGIVGFALGMAMSGLRPVIEMQFDAFAYPAFEQIVSHVAKLRNRTRGALSARRWSSGCRMPAASAESSITVTPVRGLLRAHPRAEGGYAGDGRGRLFVAARGDRRSRIRWSSWSRRSCTSRPPGRLPVRTDPFGRAVVRRPGRDATLVPTGRRCRSPWPPPRPQWRRTGTWKSSTCAASCPSTTTQ